MTLNPNTTRVVGLPPISSGGVYIPDYATAVDLNAIRPPGAVEALVTVSINTGGGVFVNFAGQSPLGGNGHEFPAGSVLEFLNPQAIQQARFCLLSGSAALLYVTYFGGTA